MLDLSKRKQELLLTDGSLIILGGPGSGKTTIALLKANQIIENEELKNKQNVIFLSFARSTVSRVEEQAGFLISQKVQQHLEINTYHSFLWNILRSQGYLLNNKFPFQLLTPPEAASRLADIKDKKERNAEKIRLFNEEGLIHFDLFAKLTHELLSKSKALTSIICDSYPVIILDEFQDTNKDEWNFIKVLGKKSRLIVLADPEQRIYEFRGADPKRIGEFIKEYNPKSFDFGTENNRSNGTDILIFGNDLLTGDNKNKKYKDIHIIKYKFRQGDGIHLDVKFAVLESVKRLVKSGKENWSLAILLPTQNLMIDVSKFLLSKQTLTNGLKLPDINHEAALETAGPSLAAMLIAGLLEKDKDIEEIEERLIRNLSEHIRGRKGDKPANKTQLSLSNALLNYLESKQIKGKNRKFCIDECLRIVNKCKKIDFSGDPVADWITIRNLLLDSENDELKQVAIDAQYLRLLGKGTILRSNLGEMWRNSETYNDATVAVRNALLQEHFATSGRVWKGIQVMTMHKAKGKEFDEVIIYEGYYNSRIANTRNIDQSRLNFRVSITRAMNRVTILTPQNYVCEFL